ncbi:hypothetical protein DJ568_00570 [Mucilaginibacter hurinus]|uniref:DUF5050 domain-containing protein n=1 Tax=Mucilaginibacter hurinus TaxID=2201324 RepID=A0A367GT91_9SPHI|nr:hypothetical protein [Mucilaginibacter hurinus]RCH56388.1 hypothetical protein DJ568_00570 [Mucilaginibacter hurinus]
MTKKFTLAALLALILFGCSKNNNNPGPEEENPTGANSTVFYADTFRVYKTDMAGGDRKLVVDEDIKSGNNYIGYLTTIPGKGKVVYTYTTGYQDGTSIRIVNADGSEKKILKTIPAGTTILFIKGVGNQIFYRTGVYNGTSVTTKTYAMDADGSNDKELTGIPNGGSITETQISSEGKGILSDDGYFMKLDNGVFKEAESFYAFKAADKTDMYDIAISADASKGAFLYKITDTKYEIRIKDLSATSSFSTLYTLNLPAAASRSVNILWVNGNKNVMVYWGKFTIPTGSPDDYTQCELIDASTGKATIWKFTGDEIGNVVAD